MNSIIKMFVTFQLYLHALKKYQKGQAIVEYALILVLIAIVCIAALKLVGGGANNALSKVGSALQ